MDFILAHLSQDLSLEDLASLIGFSPSHFARLFQQTTGESPSTPMLRKGQAITTQAGGRRGSDCRMLRAAKSAAPYPLTSTISPQLQSVLDTMGNVPAYIINLRWDIIGWNQAMRRVFPDFDESSQHEQNVPRSLFTNPLLRTVLHDWEKEARGVLALFRASTDRYVEEPWFKALVGELQQTSREFREWWPQHDIQSVYTGRKELNHPLFGPLALQTSTFEVVDAPDLRMVIFTAAEAETARKLIRLAEPEVSAG
ncbi:MAG: hypothetical protein PVSMB5_31190 [Ktedonobacteraceae bacterium]